MCMDIEGIMGPFLIEATDQRCDIELCFTVGMDNLVIVTKMLQSDGQQKYCFLKSNDNVQNIGHIRIEMAQKQAPK